jgi:hypothetical protein
MYDDRGYIVNQPNLTPVAGLEHCVEVLPMLRHKLPFFIKSYVESNSTYRFGDEWPSWDWLGEAARKSRHPGP